MSQPRRPSPVRRPAIRDSISGTSASATGSTATTTEIAMHRSPADPKPALTAASATASRSASGSTTMWFLAPPSAWTRLPCAGARLVDVPRDRRRADEGHRGDGRVLEQRVDGDLVALHHVEDPGGSPASAQHSAISSEADGSFSLGLRTTALPQAIATGTNHSGTMAGKLNGEITATTPSGWRSE